MTEEFIVACRGRRKGDADRARFAKISVRTYTGAVDIGTTPYANMADRMPNDRAALVAELLSQLLPADGPRWIIEEAPPVIEIEEAPAPPPIEAAPVAREEVAF